MATDKLYTIEFGSDALPLKLGKISLISLILTEGQYVVTKKSAQKALGYEGKSENWLFEFLMHINRLTVVEPALLESIAIGLQCHQKQDESNIIPTIEAKWFLEACKTIVETNNAGFLYLSELRFAKAAENILKNIGSNDFEKLIDFAAGADRYKSSRKEAISRMMAIQNNQPYAIWLKSFPDRFYDDIFQFQGWSWDDLSADTTKIAGYFNELIFSRIDDALLEELATSKPKMKYRKPNVAEQYLENPKLHDFILAISALMNASGKNKVIFEQLLNKSFPKLREIKNTVQQSERKQHVKLSVFDSNLRKALNTGKKQL